MFIFEHTTYNFFNTNLPIIDHEDRQKRRHLFICILIMLELLVHFDSPKKSEEVSNPDYKRCDVL